VTTIRSAAKPRTKTKAPAIDALCVSSDVSRGVGVHMVRLSDPEMRPAMDRLKERIASDPEFANSLLQSAGIVTPKGKLTKRFRG
jgi:hypothetical protein